MGLRIMFVERVTRKKGDVKVTWCGKDPEEQSKVRRESQ